MLPLLASSGISRVAFLVSEGTVLADNVSGYAFNTNSVQVAAGATLRGTGIVHLGCSSTITKIAGNADAPAVLEPGSINPETGAEVYGPLSFASETYTYLNKEQKMHSP